jgi:hypothetical protein
MAKDVYYVVKVKFYGNMTHDKGFYYTYYDDYNLPAEGEAPDLTTHTKYFATTFLEPKSARQLFPCFDGECDLWGDLKEIEPFLKFFHEENLETFLRKTL